MNSLGLILLFLNMIICWFKWLVGMTHIRCFNLVAYHLHLLSNERLKTNQSRFHHGRPWSMRSTWLSIIPRRRSCRCSKWRSSSSASSSTTTSVERSTWPESWWTSRSSRWTCRKYFFACPTWTELASETVWPDGYNILYFWSFTTMNSCQKYNYFAKIRSNFAKH